MNCAVVGGGASGLMCAVSIKQKCPGIGVTVFEKNERVGKKLLATGNGRCNMLNMNARADNYYKARDFVLPTTSKYTPESNSDFFREMGLYSHCDEEGRVYPLSNQAATVLDKLRLCCDMSGVITKVSSAVESIAFSKGKYIINGEKFDIVVFAVGSKASVKGYNGKELIESIGHKFTALYPALARLKTNSSLPRALKGVRSRVKLTMKTPDGNFEESGEIIFGDGTISGICAMNLSSYVSQSGGKAVLYVDFVPSYTKAELNSCLKTIKKQFASVPGENLLSGFMNKKLGNEILKSAGFSPAQNIGKLTDADIKIISERVKSFKFEITGIGDFADAQVCAGGVDLSEVNPYTLESKKRKGIYFCGEVLDCHGPCGGYNLGWAWSSARTAARAITEKYDKGK